jgi:hypothetical protein
MRECGQCQLCCKLLPVEAVDKLAGQRCKYQRHHKGCAIHAKLMAVAPACAVWNCRWLVEDDTHGLSRPDRSHYVLDIMPDFVTLRNDLDGSSQHVQVVQIWVDPGYPDAHRDPALRAYLERRAKENIVGIVRWDDKGAMVIFPPSMNQNRQWNEVMTNMRTKTHSFAEIAAALQPAAT